MKKLREKIKNLEGTLFRLLEEEKIKCYSVEIYGFRYTGQSYDGYCTIWVHVHGKPNASFDFYPDEDFSDTLQMVMEYIDNQ